MISPSTQTAEVGASNVSGVGPSRVDNLESACSGEHLPGCQSSARADHISSVPCSVVDLVSSRRSVPVGRQEVPVPNPGSRNDWIRTPADFSGSPRRASHCVVTRARRVGDSAGVAVNASGDKLVAAPVDDFTTPNRRTAPPTANTAAPFVRAGRFRDLAPRSALSLAMAAGRAAGWGADFHTH